MRWPALSALRPPSFVHPATVMRLCARRIALRRHRASAGRLDCILRALMSEPYTCARRCSPPRPRHDSRHATCQSLSEAPKRERSIKVLLSRLSALRQTRKETYREGPTQMLLGTTDTAEYDGTRSPPSQVPNPPSPANVQRICQAECADLRHRDASLGAALVS